MAENLRPSEEQPENEQTQEHILDALESTFERRLKAELTVLQANGELRTNSVFIEGLEGGVLYVSASESSPVMPLETGSIKKAKLVEKEK